MYELLKRDGLAKRGRFTTVHGTVETPVFMNVGTAAAIKGAVSTDDLREIKTQVELSNTYHLHVRPGDEVITSAYTYTASCSVICHVGAIPVLVDTVPGTFDMNPEKVREAVSEKTKAVIAVDLAGIIYPHYRELFQIAEEKKSLFHANNEIQEAMGRIAILADGAQCLWCFQRGKNGRRNCRLYQFFFPCS